MLAVMWVCRRVRIDVCRSEGERRERDWRVLESFWRRAGEAEERVVKMAPGVGVEVVEVVEVEEGVGVSWVRSENVVIISFARETIFDRVGW